MIKENPELKSEYLKEDEKTKLMCLSGVKQYPMRVKCATLSWHTLVSAFDENKEEVKEGAMQVEGIEDVDLELVWDPPWNKDMMSEAAKLELNL